MAYLTVLSTDNYLDGVLTLGESLRLCKSKYPLYVMVGSAVTRPVRETLARAGVRSIDAPPLDIPEEIRDANINSDYHQHWSGTFEKLLVFSLVQFRKLVYLDSDTLVLRNIDLLFEKPHMSAVMAERYAGNEDSVDLNAGLMVIEPEPELTGRLIATLPEAFESEKRWRTAAGRPLSMGDQSVINMLWSDWIASDALHLDGKYNVLTTSLHHYRRTLNYSWRGPDGIRVLHFIGQVKPWMWGGLGLMRQVARLLRHRRISELAALIAYKTLHTRARLRLAMRASISSASR
jgi:glycogenin